MVKGVVDVSRGLVAIDAELHADLETLLLEQGSRQGDLWGINLYPDEVSEDFIEFASLINIRPLQNNRGRGGLRSGDPGEDPRDHRQVVCMSEYRHTELADGCWAELPLAKQMGNIGSEVSRALRWKEKEKSERMMFCVERALELIDLSIRWAQREESRKKHPGALRELTRLRDVVCDYFLGENEYSSEGETLLRYFDQFALAVTCHTP